MSNKEKCEKGCPGGKSFLCYTNEEFLRCSCACHHPTPPKDTGSHTHQFEYRGDDYVCVLCNLPPTEGWEHKLQMLADIYQDEGYEDIIEDLKKEIQKAYNQGMSDEVENCPHTMEPGAVKRLVDQKVREERSRILKEVGKLQECEEWCNCLDEVKEILKID